MAAASSDEALKARIIGHMNKDHAPELSQYLRAFNATSTSAARGAQLTDLSLSSLSLRTPSGAKHNIPITPPMTSFSESRVRLVDMAKQAQQKLGLSDITITTFTPPEGPGIVSFSGVAFYFLSFLALPFIQPGTAAWDLIDTFWPFGGASGFKWLTNTIFLPVLLIHITEAWWIARTRLYKHNVEGRNWFLWTAGTFFEGVPSFQRFDRLVEAEKTRREGIKH